MTQNHSSPTQNESDTSRGIPVYDDDLADTARHLVRRSAQVLHLENNLQQLTPADIRRRLYSSPNPPHHHVQ